MKLDGAVEPRHGAPPCVVQHGRSSCTINGVKMFEQTTGDKQCETRTPIAHKQQQQQQQQEQPQCVDEEANALAASAEQAAPAAEAALINKIVSFTGNKKNNNDKTNTDKNSSVCQTDCSFNNNSANKKNAKLESIKPAANQAKHRGTEIKQNQQITIVGAFDLKSLTGSAITDVAAKTNLVAGKSNERKMRAQQSFMSASNGSGSNNNDGSGFDFVSTGQSVSCLRAIGVNMSQFNKIVLCLVAIVAVLPAVVLGDDGDNFFAVNSFSMGPETTTPEFDYASRGQKKFGDKCENTLECGFPGSICDPKKKSCQCTEDLPVTNHIDKCGKEAAVNESCFFNEQCEVKYFQTECRDGRCICRFEMIPFWGKDGSVECKAGRENKRGTETYIDPAMIGVLVGMALMFVIICVVLRLFSQARWRENRTIFNTPNPRLMNVSLLRDSKLLHGQERRGSRMSVRAPSRQPSMASLRPHSPNPSLGKTGSRSGSHGSNASATSVRSNRSNSVAPGKISNHERKASSHHQQQQQQSQNHEPLITNITANPVAESVTVEIIESGK